jgi:hypothetical protein
MQSSDFSQQPCLGWPPLYRESVSPIDLLTRFVFFLQMGIIFMVAIISPSKYWMGATIACLDNGSTPFTCLYDHGILFRPEMENLVSSSDLLDKAIQLYVTRTILGLSFSLRTRLSELQSNLVVSLFSIGLASLLTCNDMVKNVIHVCVMPQIKGISDVGPNPFLSISLCPLLRQNV